jgi:hypothetical protein
MLSSHPNASEVPCLEGSPREGALSGARSGTAAGGRWAIGLTVDCRGFSTQRINTIKFRPRIAGYHRVLVCGVQDLLLQIL